MPTFLGPSVWSDISSAAKAAKGGSSAAVAYFGTSGNKLLPLRSGSTLVVNASIDAVSRGITSPAALRRLLKKGVLIFSAQNLHAKVYVFDKVAFVGSANASTNSEKHLAEAVVRLDDANSVAAARAFVAKLAVTQLSDADLVELEKSYVPPKPQKFPKKQASSTTLIMELTKEQGVGRETQVQPPRPVWENYFGLNFDQGPYPQLTLVNRGVTPPQSASGHISRHDHNLTVEIPGAEMPRPAILEIRKTGSNKYDYVVRRPASAKFKEFADLMQKVDNPLRTHGRKWLII